MELYSLHLVLEILVTLSCIMLAWITFSSVDNGRYSLIMSAGFASAAVATLIHIITMTIFVTPVEIIPLLGNLPQLVIMVAILLVSWCSFLRPCKNYTIITVFGLTLIIGTLLGVDQLASNSSSMRNILPVHMYDITLYHPLQLLLSVGWLLAGWCSYSFWKYIFPLCTSWAFFTCAVIASCILAFTPPNFLEFGIVLSVALELAALYTIIVIYLVTNYHYQVFAHPPYMERRRQPQLYRKLYPEASNDINGTIK